MLILFRRSDHQLRKLWGLAIVRIELSGDLSGAQAWRRSDAPRPDDERAADIRRLLADLGAYARQRTPGAVSASGPNRPDQIDPGDLARRIGALSPESTALQDASRELVRMSGAGVDWSADGERDALGRIVSALQQEAALPHAQHQPSL